MIRTTRIVVVATLVGLLAVDSAAAAEKGQVKPGTRQQAHPQPDTSAITAKRPKANLVVGHIATMPVEPGGYIKVGASLGIQMQVENEGDAPSGSSGKYEIVCTVLKGAPGSCPIGGSDGKSSGPVPSVPAGGQINLPPLFSATPAVAGKYRLTFLVEPTQARGRARTLEIQVGPSVKIQKLDRKLAPQRTN
jgi:hypothetical protein